MNHDHNPSPPALMKIVLLAMLLLPLSCYSMIRLNQKTISQKYPCAQEKLKTMTKEEALKNINSLWWCKLKNHVKDSVITDTTPVTSLGPAVSERKEMYYSVTTYSGTRTYYRIISFNVCDVSELYYSGDNWIKLCYSDTPGGKLKEYSVYLHKDEVCTAIASFYRLSKVYLQENP